VRTGSPKVDADRPNVKTIEPRALVRGFFFDWDARACIAGRSTPLVLPMRSSLCKMSSAFGRQGRTTRGGRLSPRRRGDGRAWTAYSQEPIAGCSAAFRRRSSNVLPRIVVKRGRGASSGTISPFTRSCSQLSLQTPCWSGSCGDSLWPRLGAWYLDHGMVARDGVARAASSKTRTLKTHGRVSW